MATGYRGFSGGRTASQNMAYDKMHKMSKLGAIRNAKATRRYAYARRLALTACLIASSALLNACPQTPPGAYSTWDSGAWDTAYWR